MNLFHFENQMNMRQHLVYPLPRELALPYKLLYLKRRLHQNEKCTILCYPERPWSVYILYKIAHLMGCRITNNPKEHHDLVIRFEDTTYASVDHVLAKLAEQTRVLNLRCTDISKTRVDAIFTQVFGYSVTVDPLTHRGPCVMKSDQNCTHDGRVIICPIEKTTPGYVYQHVVHNQMGTLVHDLRVPIIGKEIPFVYLLYRRVKDRFIRPNVYVEVAKTHDVFSPEERDKLLRFCQEFGLDYGELDVLRDERSGAPYVVDANNTPAGPANRVSARQRRDALYTLAATFKQVFFPDLNKKLDVRLDF